MHYSTRTHTVFGFWDADGIVKPMNKCRVTRALYIRCALKRGTSALRRQACPGEKASVPNESRVNSGVTKGAGTHAGSIGGRIITGCLVRDTDGR